MSEFESYDMTKFLENCEKMNLTLSTKQQKQFVRYYELLVEWNAFMNLTGITEFQEVLQKHFEGSQGRGFDEQALQQYIDTVRSVSWWRPKYGPVLDERLLEGR